MSAGNKKALAELERIRWRQRLMSQTGGVEALLELCRRVKFREQAVGGEG